MLSVLEVVKKTTDFLSSKGIEGARLNSELLIGHALGLKRMQLYLQFERLLTEAELEKIRPLVRRRAQREPIQYIFGETEWCGLKLKVDRRALIPRPETEYLVELLGGLLKTAPVRILDLGTGTGAIALALATKYESASVVAVDESTDALALAEENATAVGVAQRIQFLRSNWYDNVAPEPVFDLIVSNPPYLSANESAAAEPEVREFEPVGALVAESGGMADLEVIIAGAAARMVNGGWLALETGIAQRELLLRACEAAGLAEVEIKQDLTGRDRYVFARRP